MDPTAAFFFTFLPLPLRVALIPRRPSPPPLARSSFSTHLNETLPPHLTLLYTNTRATAAKRIEQINATWPEKCLQPGVTKCHLEHNHRLSGPLRAGRQDPVLPEELLAEHVSALKEWARIPVAVRTQVRCGGWWVVGGRWWGVAR